MMALDGQIRRRRWLYTVITRAERGLVIWLSPAVIDLNDVASHPSASISLPWDRLSATAPTGSGAFPEASISRRKTLRCADSQAGAP
jgi:hypothetical protein